MTLLKWVEDNIKPEIVDVLKSDPYVLNRLSNRTVEHDIDRKCDNIFEAILMQNIHWSSSKLGLYYFNKLHHYVHIYPEKFLKPKDLKTRIKEFRI